MNRLNPSIVVPLGVFTMVVLIVAMGTGVISDLARVFELLAVIGGLTVGGRYLLGYRHRLRMEELDRQREIAKIEAAQLGAAERILDLDDRIGELRQQEPPQEA